MSSSQAFRDFAARCHADFQNVLAADLDTDKNYPNQTSRPVRSGHYVKVKSKPLRDPELIIFSEDMLSVLGIRRDATRDEAFARFFSGDVEEGERAGLPGVAWATPYALAIYGERYTDNCPFGDGTGYGDGRALSVALVNTPSQGVWELQLKGAGPTPFCRGADGRAVLRSSVREFLASEAMHWLGVSTTRAISLVVSNTDNVRRPWYSSDHKKRIENIEIPSPDDPRLRHLPVQMREKLLQQAMYRFRQPDEMIIEKCAISCRVAPSFFRVGHFDLFARRIQRQDDDLAREQLKVLVWYAAKREYSDDLHEYLASPKTNANTQKLALAMLKLSSERIARLTAEWIRVGYCQGNFNSDNCLIAGRTMDYGPFGFIEKFSPLWNMWLGGGQHFGFLNQHVAGGKNFGIFAKSLMTLMDEEGKEAARKLIDEHENLAIRELNDVWRRKLGMNCWNSEAEKMIDELLELMTDSCADYTTFWRQLAECAGSQSAEAAFEENLRVWHFLSQYRMMQLVSGFLG